MGTAGPPSGPGSRPASGLRVRRAVSRGFDGSSPTSFDPDLRVYLADMIRPYQLELREEMFGTSVGHNYGEMAEELLLAAVPEDEPVDLLVLAFAIPDIRPGRSSALYLSSICPGRPMAFAICEQGFGAAHTALRLAREYGRDDGCRRAVVLVVEQAALHYEPARTVDGAAPPLPEGAAAVAVICDDSGTADSISVRQYPSTAPEDAQALLGKEVAALGPARSRTAVVLGGGLAHADLDAAGCLEVVVAPAGQPYTGQWSELARGFSAWSAEAAQVLVADYDNQLHCLSVSTIDTAGRDPAA